MLKITRTIEIENQDVVDLFPPENQVFRVFACEIQAEDADELIGTEGSTEEFNAALEKARDQIVSGQHTASYVVLKIT